MFFEGGKHVFQENYRESASFSFGPCYSDCCESFAYGPCVLFVELAYASDFQSR